MSPYLLDTCTISDFFLGVGDTKKHLTGQDPSNIAISTITVMEVLYGLQLSAAARRKLSGPFQSFCSAVQVFVFDTLAAEAAARIRAHLKKKGTPIGSFDLLIGAIAVANGCVLVTSNEREFRNIEELTIENWR